MEDENEIKWEDLAGGWSSVRSPQWLRSKWWSIKRQVANHKDIPFSSTDAFHSLDMNTFRFIAERGQGGNGPIRRCLRNETGSTERDK